MTGSMKDLLGDEPYVPSYIPPFQSHSTTSREAAHSIAPRISALHQRVLDYLKNNPEGATDNALGEALHLLGSTLRPRRIELVDMGLVVDSGRYARDGESRRRSTVWCLKSQSDRGPYAILKPPI